MSRGGVGLQTSCSAINQMSRLFCSVSDRWAISNSYVICKVRRVDISMEDINTGSIEDAVDSRDKYVISNVFLLAMYLRNGPFVSWSFA